MIASFGNQNSVADCSRKPAATISFEIENAGLVITAAFLPRLFEMLGFVERRVFKTEGARQNALRVLRYTVFGETSQVTESALARLLCGVEPGIPVDEQSPLSAEQINAVDSMLTGVINNWDIGNTNVEGLKSTFLARAGILRKEANVWQLEVVSEPFDVLLERLPWAYSVVKLQWMEQAIHVKWR